MNVLATLNGTTSVVVDNGSTLNLVNGAGVALTSLTTLSLGAATGATFGFELGASNAASGQRHRLRRGLAANTILFNITALTGFGTTTTYDLLTAAATSNLAAATYTVASGPGRLHLCVQGHRHPGSAASSPPSPRATFTGPASLDPELVELIGGNSNFSTDAVGDGRGRRLARRFEHRDLLRDQRRRRRQNHHAGQRLLRPWPEVLNAVAGDVTIASGLGGTASTLTIGTGGIDVQTGAPAVTTISAPVIVGGNPDLEYRPTRSPASPSAAASPAPPTSPRPARAPSRSPAISPASPGTSRSAAATSPSPAPAPSASPISSPAPAP